MDTLQTTLELMEIDSGDDEIDSDFERELLSDPKASKPTSSKQTNQQIKENERSSDLDDRIIQMEFETLQARIDELVRQNVPFGNSGMVTSAVAYKDLTSMEVDQLKVNAIAISAFTNKILEKLDHPDFLGMVTITLIADDLYQASFTGCRESLVLF